MYIVLEGIDTCGKSTQINALKKAFPNAIFTKEPGGSALGATLREMILQNHSQDYALHSSCVTPQCLIAKEKAQDFIQNHAFSEEAEFFLFLADRAEHFSKIIKPNLHSLIIADRSLISGIAYSKHKDAEMMNLACAQGIVPDICFAFKISADELNKRLQNKQKDSIENRGSAYLMAIQSRILHFGRKIAKQCVVIDADKQQEDISQEIITHIRNALDSKMDSKIETKIDFKIESNVESK